MADFIGKENDFVQQDLPSAAQFARMTVPDRIVLAGICIFFDCLEVTIVCYMRIGKPYRMVFLIILVGSCLISSQRTY